MLNTAASEQGVVGVPASEVYCVVMEDRQTTVTGVILIVSGLFSILITAIGLGVYSLFSFLAHGIWFGIVVSQNIPDYFIVLLLATNSASWEFLFRGGGCRSPWAIKKRATFIFSITLANIDGFS